MMDGPWAVLIITVSAMVAGLATIALLSWRDMRQTDELAVDVRLAMTTESRHSKATTMHITCPQCGKTSYHPRDVAEGYCGNCHAFTSKCARCFLAILDIEPCPENPEICVVCCIQTGDPCGHVASYLNKEL